uniref:HEAT repeat domain-containing protein n=1 Tax=Noctiluca scintillans TaxID=2966 RepID=A0A7S1AUE8_NOCSC
MGTAGAAAKPAIELLAHAALYDCRDGVGQVAAEALGTLGDVAKSSVPLLTEGLRESQAEVREAAATALGQLGPIAAPARDELAACLSDPETSVRIGAAKAIGNLGEAAAPVVKQLAAAIKDTIGPDDAYGIGTSEAAKALQSLGQLSLPAKDVLVVGLQDPNVRIRAACVEVFGSFGAAAQPFVQKIAAMALYDSKVEETAFGRRVSGREAAIVTLKRLGKDAEGAFPTLMTALSDDKVPDIVAEGAILSLGALRKVAGPVVTPLTELLGNKQALLRRRGALALAELGKVASSSTAKLVEAMENHLQSDTELSVAALMALRNITESKPEVVRPFERKIQAAAQSPDRSVQQAAQAVCEMLSEE